MPLGIEDTGGAPVLRCGRRVGEFELGEGLQGELGGAEGGVFNADGVGG